MKYYENFLEIYQNLKEFLGVYDNQPIWLSLNNQISVKTKKVSLIKYKCISNCNYVLCDNCFERITRDSDNNEIYIYASR